MYKHYTTIGNLIDTGLFTRKELMEAYAEYSYESGRELSEPVDYWYFEGEKYRSRDINSVDYRFYLAVKAIRKYKINNGFKEENKNDR